MNREKVSRVSIADAARRVGRAMFADQWIDTITPRETWLIERYVEGRGRGEGLIVPSKTVWEIGGRRWYEYPSDPALVAEVERARDRRDWREDQWERAFHWLEEHGFDLDAADIDRDALEAAIAKQGIAKPDVRFPHDETSETKPAALTACLRGNGSLAKRLAEVLRKRYPDGRPAMTNKQILADIASGQERVSASIRTLSRALRILGWHSS